MNTERVPISKIKPNPDNPRIIRDEKFLKLKKSIQDFPEMLELRPLVVDSDGVILGGNMRFRALQDLGMKEVTVVRADTLTSEQKREFIIKDNVGFGEWDYAALGKDWNVDELGDWGLDIPGTQSFEDKNQEIDVSEFSNEMTIKLNYSEEEYIIVKEQLSKIADTPEQAVWKLLGNE